MSGSEQQDRLEGCARALIDLHEAAFEKFGMAVPDAAVICRGLLSRLDAVRALADEMVGHDTYESDYWAKKLRKAMKEDRK